ncbi:hypothetical protein VP01_1846g5 [Puccinia sorghi]|uniref:Major facilitator superfamily (MFS) profile domain-containing protein n=1 Tax=Puccinia sorghi TaxID=27349 RepID=A0A0L6VDM7_9BASI|nr:hypothetical protein VP01_1846g5 [Puccinia sorghi]
MIGAWIWGSYSDSYGRRGPFNGTLLMTAIFGLFSGFAPTFGWLCFSFSFGAVISSFLGLLILPGSSCKEPPTGKTLLCNSQVENLGWRYLLIVLGVLTLMMFACRVALFNLEESPKYLISHGRAADAVLVLEFISVQNGAGLTITEADVEDNSPGEASAFDHHYSALVDNPQPNGTNPHTKPNTTLSYVSDSWKAPFTRGIENLKYRVWLLMTPELKITTVLVWAIWATVSFAYTSFNVFLPAYLEKRHREKSSIEETLKEYLLYTLAGIYPRGISLVHQRHGLWNCISTKQIIRDDRTVNRGLPDEDLEPPGCPVDHRLGIPFGGGKNRDTYDAHLMRCGCSDNPSWA